MFAIATQADRLTMGRGKELAIQGTMIVKAEMAPMGIKNIAKKRAPRFVVPVAMAFPAAATSIRTMIWIDRSFVFEAVKVTMTDVRKVANHTMIYLLERLPDHTVQWTHQEPSTIKSQYCRIPRSPQWRGRNTETSGTASSYAATG